MKKTALIATMTLANLAQAHSLGFAADNADIKTRFLIGISVEGLDSTGKVLGTPFLFGLNIADTVQVADTVGGQIEVGGYVLNLVRHDVISK